jgi:MGT family glycosyltransferase
MGCTVPVARELLERGDEVAFSVFDFHAFLNRSNELIPASDIEGMIAREGFRVIDSTVPEIEFPGKCPMVKNFLLQYREFQSLFRDFLIPYYEHWAMTMLPRFREYRPDVVWVKDQALSGAMAASAMGVPWATFSVHTGLIEDEDSLPWMMGFSPPKTIFGRQMNAFMKWSMRKFRMTLDDAFNASRARLGLPPLEDALRTTAISPHLYTLFVAKEIEPPRRAWPEQVRFVGPYHFDEPRDYKRPAWLSELPADKPLVYSTLGTSSNRLEMHVFELLMDALADEPVVVAISTGDEYVKQRLKQAPANFYVESFLPNSVLIPRAKALVHHGGAMTAVGSLHHGVPSVVVPGNTEHFDFAQRLVERGCGIRINQKSLTAPKLRDAVRRILGEEAFRTAAQKARADLAHYDSPRACADLLQELGRSRARVEAPRAAVAS